MESMVLDAWNDLSYIEGALFTFWLFILVLRQGLDR